MNKWIVEEDLISEDTPKDIQVSNFENPSTVELVDTTKFRLLDDDGIVYFTGRSEDSSSFGPLDSYGVGFGCTSIEYLENGKWEVL